ncbi:MAG: hypothetical protein ABW321_11910 [Polyangiales bacterium]
MALAGCESNAAEVVEGERDAGHTPDAEVVPAVTPDAGSDADSSSAPIDPSVPCPLLVPTKTLSGSIDEDSRWSGIIAVTDNVSVVGAATVEIAPGTTFIMDADTRIGFGWNSSAPSLFARGTAALPIRVCGKQPVPGYHRGLLFEHKVKSDSVLEHVIISDAGGSDLPSLTISSALAVQDVRIENAAADGVRASDFGPDSTRLVVRGVAGAPVVLTEPGAASHFPSDSLFDNNVQSVVGVDFSGIDSSTTFKAIGLPYELREGLSVFDATLTVEAGVTFRFAVDSLFELGWNSAKSTLLMQGTADRPIVLERASAAAPWQGIHANSKVTTSSVFSHVTIRGAGGLDRPALTLLASVTLDHVTLEDNQTLGLKLTAALSERSQALTITGTDGPPAETSLNTAVSLPADGHYSGNNEDWIVVDGTGFTSQGILHHLDVPYRVVDSLSGLDGSELTIEAGTTLQMAPDVLFELGWNSAIAKLHAVGTAANKITFRGVSEVAGSWRGLLINSKVPSDSVLDYVEIRHAGRMNEAALTLKRPFNVTNTAISGSAGYAIATHDTDTTDYTQNNTLDGNAQGAIAPL